MTEEQALDYFDSLPVDDRLHLMQRMLADMEYRIARARAELAGNNPAQALDRPDAYAVMDQPDLPGLDLPPPQEPADPEYRHDPVFGHLDSAPAEPTRAADEWAGFELPPESGGPAHAVHRLRLMDAAAQYERLLKRYGYIKSPPGLDELTRRWRAAQASATEGKGTSWADWVARDQATLDRPKPQQWQDWVAIGDDDE